MAAMATVATPLLSLLVAPAITTETAAAAAAA
eukprot:COSAG01_NODE_49323_length_373_cov_0.755474_1_plen_31_part_10